MKFGPVPLDAALGAILAHSHPGAEGRLRKGRVLEAADLAAPRVAELQAQGAAILCWTIKSAEDEAKARKYAQNITFEGYAALPPA